MPHPATPGADPRLGPLYRKITWRLLPFLLLCYVFAYLDRINIGFAKLQMQQDIGISDAVYGLGAGIFFLGYVMFEVPSNLLLARIGARRTISRIMVLWGLTSASMLFVQGEWSFYVLRFMLGVFEAGFAPGMIFYLTYWYSQSRMAGVMAVVMLAGPIGGIVGGPVSAWIMTAFSGAHGLDGWQWMFLLEGLPCVLIGIVAYRYLDDKPAQAKWLSAEEKALLAADLDARSGQQKHAFRQVLRDPAIYGMALTYFCLICGIYAVSFWLPTLLKLAGVKDTMEIGLYSAVPYIAAAAFMLLFARSSDRMQERRWHTLVPALLAGVALCVATTAPTQFALSLAAITLATGFMWASYTVFWAIPSQYRKGEGRRRHRPDQQHRPVGRLPQPVHHRLGQESTGSLAGGLYAISALLVAGALLLLVNRPSQPAHATARA